MRDIVPGQHPRPNIGHPHGSTIADGVIRATTAALREAGTELAVPAAKLTEEPAPANGPATSDSSDDTPDKGAASENDT